MKNNKVFYFIFKTFHCLIYFWKFDIKTTSKHCNYICQYCFYHTTYKTFYLKNILSHSHKLPLHTYQNIQSEDCARKRRDTMISVWMKIVQIFTETILEFVFFYHVDCSTISQVIIEMAPKQEQIRYKIMSPFVKNPTAPHRWIGNTWVMVSCVVKLLKKPRRLHNCVLYEGNRSA